MNKDVSNITLALHKCDPSSLESRNILTVSAASFIAGYNYEKGTGGSEQSDKMAVEWYSNAARIKFPQAQNNLGWMYANGRGVEQDFLLAYMWFHLAAVRDLYEGNENCKTMVTAKLVSKENIAEATSRAEEYR